MGFVPLSSNEQSWIREHLTPKEKNLFECMSNRDQHHAIRVSTRVAAMAAADPTCEIGDVKTLIRAGLLHDIGRQRGDVGLIDKVIVVIVRRCAPGVAAVMSKRGLRAYELDRRAFIANVCRAFYVQDVHPRIGAHKAREAGVEDRVVSLILNHHSDVKDNKLLTLFAAADY